MLEKIKFKPTEHFQVIDIEGEIKRHFEFGIDVVWEVDDWYFLDNGEIEVILEIK